jgi:hypothetical protein
VQRQQLLLSGQVPQCHCLQCICLQCIGWLYICLTTVFASTCTVPVLSWRLQPLPLQARQGHHLQLP